MVEGTPEVQVVDEIKPEPGDQVVFYGTDFELILRARGIDTVIVFGVITNVCVANMIRAARKET